MTIIDGTASDDSLYGGSTDDTINGFDGNDSLYGGDGTDILNGGNDNDYLDGGTGADTLNGESGSDYFVVGLGDTVNGGADADFAAIDLSSVSTAIIAAFDFTRGHVNTLPQGTTFKNIEAFGLTTGSGSDTLTLDDSAVFGANANTGSWYGGNGEDTLIVDWHKQTFAVSASTSSVSVGSTSYNLSSIEHLDITGGSGFDTLSGGSDSDILNGGDGNDTLTGASGSDVLNGGSGNDTISAGTSTDSSGADTVTGGAGDDTISAGSGDTVDGGSGRDVLNLDLADHGDAANFVFNPGASQTILGVSIDNIEQIYLSTGSGNDHFTLNSDAIVSSSSYNDGSWDAGAGNDTLIVDFSQVIFSLNAGTSSLSVGDFIFGYSDVEAFQFTGGSGFDTLTGGGARDILTGNDGNDTLTGAAGNDTLKGGGENDTLYGGTGNDTESGGTGRDTLDGEDGNDTMDGGSGNDDLTGGLSNDTLKGGQGFDSLQGDAGADTLDGGAGTDFFYYNSVSDSTGRAFDIVKAFDFSADHFTFNTIGINQIDPAVSGGRLSHATFNTDIHAKITAANLLAHDAVIWTPGSGTYGGATFLIIDANGVAGYQTGADFVIQILNPVHFSALDIGDL